MSAVTFQLRIFRNSSAASVHVEFIRQDQSQILALVDIPVAPKDGSLSLVGEIAVDLITRRVRDALYEVAR